MKPILFTLILAIAAYYGWTYRSGNDAATADLSAPQIQQLAASVKAEEVVMYSTTVCSYCHAAKGWLAQNGFDYGEFLSNLRT